MAGQARYPQYTQSDTFVEAVFGEQAEHSQYVPDMSGVQQLGGQIERAAMTQVHRNVPDHTSNAVYQQREKVNQMLVDTELEANRMMDNGNPSFG